MEPLLCMFPAFEWNVDAKPFVMPLVDTSKEEFDKTTKEEELDKAKERKAGKKLQEELCEEDEGAV